MKIIKKEILEFSEHETNAMWLVMEICTGLDREATDPDLRKLANEIYNKVAELWGYEEED